MTIYTILLDNPTICNQFVSRARYCPYNIDVQSGRKIVDGKSLLGLFTLNLSIPVTVTVHATEERSDDFMTWLDTVSRNS